MSPKQQDPDELGALWSKTGGKGEYMTGTINGVSVVCFKNARKQAGDKQPDWRVLKSRPKEADQVSHPSETVTEDVPF